MILALGDSLTAWYWLEERDAYPAQLETELTARGYTYRVQNAGISGDTTATLLSRLEWVLTWEKPDLIILCIGANDALQGKPVEEIKKNVRDILTMIAGKNIPVLLAGMQAPRNLWTEYNTLFAQIYPDLAKEYNVPLMDFFLSWVAMDDTLNQSDRIHPTREWYTRIVKNIIPLLEKEKLIHK